MKRIPLLLFSLFIMITVGYAQDHTIFLFESFTNAKIKFKNRSVTVVSANYDAGHGRMLYKQNNEIMEITNSYAVDSVLFGKRCFIPSEKRYLEKLTLKHGVVYVNWILKDVNIGSKGAFGLATQGKVETLRSFDFGLSSETYTAYDKQATKSTDMFKRKNANTYFIYQNNKLIEIKSQKQLLKMFPEKQEQIKDFISNEKIDYKEVNDALVLIDFCLSL